MNESPDILIAGGGIGGLAAALACGRNGCRVRLFERAPFFSEVGAGIQIGPNVVRILSDWGLASELAQVAAFPDRLRVRSALTGEVLAQLTLKGRAESLYGAPYATVHRADLHQLLLQAVRGCGDVALNLDSEVAGVVQSDEVVTLALAGRKAVEGDALIGADGLWSVVRRQWPNPSPVRVAGHLAYRAMLPQDILPAALRTQDVTAWLGPRLHVVMYPVRGGRWLNVVAIVQGTVEGGLENWDHSANGTHLLAALAGASPELLDVVRGVPQWRLWVLCDRPPLAAADEMVQGRVALLGDAAHPMRPYLAQGAGMAIEDAHELGQMLSMTAIDLPTRLRRYALNRWQRCARVQRRSERNGKIFHAQGVVRWGRDLGLRMLGERLLDVPWLYGGNPLSLR